MGRPDVAGSNWPSGQAADGQAADGQAAERKEP